MGQKVVVKRTPKLSIPQIPADLIQDLHDWALSEGEVTPANLVTRLKMVAAMAAATANAVNLMIESSGGKTIEVDND